MREVTRLRGWVTNSPGAFLRSPKKGEAVCISGIERGIARRSMKLAISNIAWQPHEDDAISNKMQELGVKGVEIAPTKNWLNPLEASDSEIARVRSFWESRGIRIVAMQALLFGRPDLVVFGTAEKRRETREYLAKIILLGQKLGAQVLVFGSPGNRRVGGRAPSEIEAIATEFFYEMGEIAQRYGLVLCIEPNPPVYGCDFITTAVQGTAFVRKVNHPQFRLHLDTGAMTLSGEDIPSALRDCIGEVRHFHVSEPNLAPIGIGQVPHEVFAKAIKDSGYPHWLSIEMKAQSKESNSSAVAAALSRVRGYYFD